MKGFIQTTQVVGFLQSGLHFIAHDLSAKLKSSTCYMYMVKFTNYSQSL